eukprot:scaffold2865_cov356-Prasinococcus_capsulatus_cf.AAC.1
MAVGILNLQLYSRGCHLGSPGQEQGALSPQGTKLGPRPAPRPPLSTQHPRQHLNRSAQAGHVLYEARRPAARFIPSPRGPFPGAIIPAALPATAASWALRGRASPRPVSPRASPATRPRRARSPLSCASSARLHPIPSQRSASPSARARARAPAAASSTSSSFLIVNTTTTATATTTTATVISSSSSSSSSSAARGPARHGSCDGRLARPRGLQARTATPRPRHATPRPAPPRPALGQSEPDQI